MSAQCICVIDHAVDSVIVFVLRQVGPYVVHCGLCLRYLHAEMTRVGEDFAVTVPVVSGLAGPFVVVVAWLGDKLIDNAVQLLFGKEVVVPMEEDRDLVLDH